MSILPRPEFDYTSRDFDAIRFRLQGLIRSVFPDWTDFNVSNFGNLLLELDAYAGDTKHFYIDGAARQAFWPTVDQRVSAIRLGRQTGFALPGATAATVDLTFSLPSAAAVAVPILQGTRCKTKDPANPISFQTLAADVIAIGQTSITIPAEQSIPAQELFNSSGAPNQEFTLSQTPFLDDSAVVTAVNGDYTEVDSFLGAGPTSRVFVVLVDQFDQARLRFGTGTNGAIPQGAVVVDYKTGGGSNGNVDIDQIQVLDTTIIDSNGDVAPISVTNLVKASGGGPRMTVKAARVAAPAARRVLTRCVTKDDFETKAQEVPGVARALMATSNESPAVQENTGLLYIIAKGASLPSGRILGATPSQALLDEVLEQVTVNFPQTLTFLVTPMVATYTTINVSTRVYLATGSSPAVVGPLIASNLRDFFAVLDEDGLLNTTVDFGANLKDTEGVVIAELAWSDIFNVIRDTAGVRKVDEGPVGLLLNSLRQSVVIGALNFPQLGTISITNAATGLPMPTA